MDHKHLDDLERQFLGELLGERVRLQGELEDQQLKINFFIEYLRRKHEAPAPDWILDNLEDGFKLKNEV